MIMDYGLKFSNPYPNPKNKILQNVWKPYLFAEKSLSNAKSRSRDTQSWADNQNTQNTLKYLTTYSADLPNWI